MRLRRSVQKSVSMYFYVHEPYTLSKLSFFDMGKQNQYFSKNIRGNYLYVNDVLRRVLEEYKDFSFSMSLSGVFLDQCANHEPKILESFKELVDTNRVEIVTETFYHSLSWLFSKQEFAEQIKLHMKTVYDVFRKKPKIFRNTELIYNNELAQFIKTMGFSGTIAEGWDISLHGKSPNHIYTPVKSGIRSDDKKIAQKYSISQKNDPSFKVLLKNYRLSDQFSSNSDPYFFAEQIDNEKGETINIFVDYDAIYSCKSYDMLYDYWKKLVERVLEYKYKFRTISETISYYDEKFELDQHELISWRDINRDLTSWTGNEIQNGALRSVYELEDIIKNRVKKKKDKAEAENILKEWRLLQTSDYFRNMNTTGNMNDTAYDSYINYMNVLNDLMSKI